MTEQIAGGYGDCGMRRVSDVVTEVCRKAIRFALVARKTYDPVTVPSLDELAQRLTDPELGVERLSEPTAQEIRQVGRQIATQAQTDDEMLAAIVCAHWEMCPDSERLPDGTTGFYARGRLEMCFAAAIMTDLQIPEEFHWRTPYPTPRTVPDPLRLIDKSNLREFDDVMWDAWDRWCEAWNIRMVIHKRVPPLPSARRWVGVGSSPSDPLEKHCLVMLGRDVLFNPGAPAWMWRRLGVQPSLADVQWGVSFDRR